MITRYGIAIEHQKRQRSLRALAHVAVVENARSVGEVCREQDVERPESHRVQKPPRERADGHAAAPVVRRVRRRVAFSRRVVELALPARRQHEVVRHLAVVDLWPRDAHVDGRHRRQVLDEQDRQSFARHGVRRTERHAHAVRVGEVLVDEAARRQRRRVHLARREHHLPQLPANVIAVVVDGEEVVVRSDRLDLAERLQQRLAIPQSHVVDRRAVRGHELRREARLGAELALRDAVQAPRLTRGADVVEDLRRLARELVRLHDESLVRGRHGRREQRDGDVADRPRAPPSARAWPRIPPQKTSRAPASATTLST